MVYRGTIRQGTIVLDETPQLPEGARVQVEVVEEASRKGAFHPVGPWEGPPGEFDQLLDAVQRLRDGML